MTDAPMTRTTLAAAIERLTGASHEEIGGDTDLRALGLDQDAILRLANSWRVRGLPVTYQELADQPTLDAWWARISHLLRVNPYLAS